MSNVSTAHDVINYVSGKSVALDGQRLAVVKFKTTANVKAPMPNKCVSVPVMEITPSRTDITADELQALYPHITSMVQKAQDEIIRAKLLENGEGYKVLDSDINMQSVILYLAEESKGNRLSKEYIAGWFADNVAELLTVALADKLGISDTPSEAESKKLQATVNMYCDKLQGLAGSKTAYTPEVADKLLRALEIAAPADDKLTMQFVSKLQAMKEKPVADLMGL